MEHLDLAQTFVFVNHQDSPQELITAEQIDNYIRFILIDQDLERIDRLAQLLESFNKEVFILRNVEELPRVIENQKIRFTDKGLKTSLLA